DPTPAEALSPPSTGAVGTGGAGMRAAAELDSARAAAKRAAPRALFVIRRSPQSLVAGGFLAGRRRLSRGRFKTRGENRPIGTMRNPTTNSVPVWQAASAGQCSVPLASFVSLAQQVVHSSRARARG